MNETRGLWHGKRIDNGEWVEGYYVSNGEDLHYIITDEFVQHLVDPSTLGECTGLTDKNGKLIFEGDIVSNDNLILVVEWDSDRATFNACWYEGGFRRVRPYPQRLR